jgi:membrane-associated phospholipid phosphatase
MRRVAAVVVLVGALGRVAAADEPVDRPHLLDAEAAAFIWLPLAGAIYLDTIEPRSTPLFFDPDEGGKERRRDYEIPQLSITFGGLAILGAMALGDDPSRGYHITGMLESMATSALATTATKVVVGRHRPDYLPTDTDPDQRKSFPSGHTTRAFSVLTYTALYLHYHGFDQWRKPGTVPWWEVASYAGLAGAGVAFAGERVERHRHNKADVAVGGTIGALSSFAFFYWQEHQYKTRAKKRRGVLDSHASHSALPATDRY